MAYGVTMPKDSPPVFRRSENTSTSAAPGLVLFRHLAEEHALVRSSAGSERRLLVAVAMARD